MHLYERKKSLIKIPTLILYLKLQPSIFGSFGNLAILRDWVGVSRTWRHFDANFGKI